MCHLVDQLFESVGLGLVEDCSLDETARVVVAVFAFVLCRLVLFKEESSVASRIPGVAAFRSVSDQDDPVVVD